MRKTATILMLLVILAAVNFMIYQKEMQLKNGSLVYLKLAPVDPRSMMQGDYMALRFAAAENILKKLKDDKSTETHFGRVDNCDGRAVIKVDADNTGTFIRLFRGEMLKPNEMIIRYRVRKNRVKFATNAYFFEEGSGRKYAKARYGAFRVDENGDPLLCFLLDEKLRKLPPDSNDSGKRP